MTLAAESYKEFRTWEELEGYCKSVNLKIIPTEGKYCEVAKMVNENGAEMAYVTPRDKAYVSNLKDDTQWVMILE